MKFKIFNAEFEADMLDYDYMVNVENELEDVQKKIGDIKEKADLYGIKQSELVHESTGVIRHFFDAVFGKGAAQKIFGDKINYGNALRAFGDYIVQKNQNSGEDIRVINDEYKGKINATKPVEDKQPKNVQQYNGNRQQRRNAQKKKGKNNPNRYHK